MILLIIRMVHGSFLTQVRDVELVHNMNEVQHDDTLTHTLLPHTIKNGLSLPYACQDPLPQFARCATVKPSYLPHPLRGVRSYDLAFPDLQEVQIVAAKQCGITPPQDRKEAEARGDELMYVGSSPFYSIDGNMQSSIPYLVPRAALLLQKIGRNFQDSLYAKGLPLHKFIVTSVLRSQEDVSRLQQTNGNASKQSCHQYGTTFDITYTRYRRVQDPSLPTLAPVSDDTLKWVLSEVLHDLRSDSLCFVKHEVRQACFHITVR
ncbi:MAG: hypothetical protein KBT12_05605 [Bacteroidales bacterium]|nr:hypothetical protein [Candidatus Physcousia equi]